MFIVGGYVNPPGTPMTMCFDAVVDALDRPSIVVAYHCRPVHAPSVDDIRCAIARRLQRVHCRFRCRRMTPMRLPIISSFSMPSYDACVRR
jgi:hypothetical protein